MLVVCGCRKVDITPIARVYSPELEERLLEIARLDTQLDCYCACHYSWVGKGLLPSSELIPVIKIEGNLTKPSELIALVDDSTRA